MAENSEPGNVTPQGASNLYDDHRFYLDTMTLFAQYVISVELSGRTNEEFINSLVSEFKLEYDSAVSFVGILEGMADFCKLFIIALQENTRKNIFKRQFSGEDIVVNAGMDESQG